MYRFLSAFVVLTFATLTASAQIPKIDFEEYDLDNGLHVILHQDKSAPTVLVSVMYHVGSKDEDPELTGFAHFFEHLMFEGSKNIDRGEFSKYVEEAGGVLNANTSHDRTYYFEFLPSNQLGLGLWLESERMLHAKVDSTGIETQRAVVKEEKKQRYDNRPYGSFQEETFKRSYTKHPYRWTPIGSLEDVNSAEEKDFINFYETFYVPNNAVLVVAGDFRKEEAKKMISTYFAGIPKGTTEIPRTKIVEPEQTVHVVDTVYDNIQLPGVIHSFKVPGMKHEDFYAAQMMFSALSGGESSRLSKHIRNEKQEALFVFAFGQPMESNPALAFSMAVTNMGVDAGTLEASMEEEYRKISEELISEEEFEKIRNQREMQFVSRLGSLQGIAEALATNYTYFGKTDIVNSDLDNYMNVTREDIKRVAAKYLKKTNRVTLYYLPKSN